MNRSKGQSYKSVIALMLGILFAIIVSEAVLRVLDFPAQPVSGWISCPAKNPGECNSLGFRGKEISYSKDDFVVVLLGDSEAYVAASDIEKMPENRLEQHMRSYRENR